MPRQAEPIPALPENWPIRGNGGVPIGTAPAARLLGKKPGSLTNMCVTKTAPVPFYKIDGRYRFDLADIEDYLNRRRNYE